MKKIALVSFLAIFAISGANAANIIDGNPLYRPSENHFYSLTNVGTAVGLEDSVYDYRMWTAGEEFGYGISDKLAVFLNTNASAFYPTSTKMSDDNYSWDNLALGLTYRYLDEGMFKADVYGKVTQLYSQAGVATSSGLETIAYLWTAGTNFGMKGDNWAVAGTAEYNYWKDDLEDKYADSLHFTIWKFGVKGQYSLSDNWNLTAGAIYSKVIADDSMMPFANYVYGDKKWNTEFGVNYNIDSAKFVGIYGTKMLDSDYNKDAYGVGAKFGIDF
ncbi:MAG TPA: hypothetical protein PKJ33_00255 [Alphaproteobacteria bacterium]|nr:hypothetical protein [Alphaproteobacteria bacterium]